MAAWYQLQLKLCRSPAKSKGLFSMSQSNFLNGWLRRKVFWKALWSLEEICELQCVAVWWWRARNLSSWDEAGTPALSACDLVHIHSLVSECEYPTHLTSPHPLLITTLHFLKEPQVQTYRLEAVTGIGWLACRAKRLLLFPQGFYTVCMCLFTYIFIFQLYLCYYFN